jgi:uncharacterized membrane protein YfcA
MTTQISWLLLACIGVFAGTASGFFGIGGGIIIVPALVLLAGFGQKMATGTSLAVLVVPVGLAAVIEYYRSGNVDIRAAAIIAVFLVATSWFSAHLATRMNATYLKLAFGVFIILVGGYIVATTAMKLGK